MDEPGIFTGDLRFLLTGMPAELDAGSLSWKKWVADAWAERFVTFNDDGLVATPNP